jgi:folylpolyglutamate synthase
MPIDLGLSRVVSLLTKLGNPQLSQNYIHVAGTNGKGSVCAYLSSVLLASTKDFKVGKFTSPHLIYRHDCITLNNTPVNWDVFRKIEDHVVQLNKDHQIGCTEFEILTVVALKVFEVEKVDIAVLEVGLGGRLDATNVVSGAVIAENGEILQKGVLATAITKIGKDHESLLGDTLEEIAAEKAGILKSGIFNVVDGTNATEVLKVVEDKAKLTGSTNVPLVSASDEIETKWGLIHRRESPLKGDYQLQNLSVSLKIIELIFPFLMQSYPQKTAFSLKNIIKGVNSTQWPGRLQALDLNYSASENPLPILLDGAHNAQSAAELRKYLNSTYHDKSLTFIIALTKGKNIDELLKELNISSRDKVVLTTFGKVDGMPWIQANDPLDVKNFVTKYTQDITIITDLPDVFKTVQSDEHIVVCGSLYLVGEVLKLHGGKKT